MRQFKVSRSITTRTSEALNSYLSEIARIPMLTIDEEVELSAKIHKGGEEAERAVARLVEANLRFVVSVAKKYDHGELPLSDLVNEGNIGLLRAARDFDATRGFKFITYAVWWIRQSISKALAENGRFIRIPNNQASMLLRLKRESEAFVQENHRQPSVEELCEILDESAERIVDVLNADARNLSTDAPVSADAEQTIADVVPAPDSMNADSEIDHISLCAELSSVINASLSPVEKRVISAAFGIGCRQQTLSEIADEMRLSHERVRQIKEKAILRIRQSEGREALRKYLCA